MDKILGALGDQHDELDGLLATLDDAGWATAVPRCPGWSVADVVLHMAQTDELGAASASGEYARFVSGAVGARGSTVDDAADAMVEQERGQPGPAVHARWRAAATGTRDALGACSPHDRVQWVAGEMAARTLATTRLSECWIHTGDVADALGVALDPTPRLWHIARLAWRTLPYAFERDGRSLHGDVGVALDAPDGSRWEFVGQGEPLTRVEGPALDFCLVAGRRLDPPDSALVATGPDAEAVLALVRTYA
jgi:uncharacterized protein (TIGR03084 family)